MAPEEWAEGRKAPNGLERQRSRRLVRRRIDALAIHRSHVDTGDGNRTVLSGAKRESIRTTASEPARDRDPELRSRGGASTWCVIVRNGNWAASFRQQGLAGGPKPATHRSIVQTREDVTVATRDPIRTAVVGYGLGGAAFHAPFIATTPGLSLTAIVTGRPERQRKAADAYPGVRIVADVEELWHSSREVDLVAISTPNRTHVPLALAAIAAGLHVVIDKPIAASSADARRVGDAAAKRDVLAVPFQNRRWDGDFLTLRRLLNESALGAPIRFESGFERWRPEPTGGWRERGTPEDAGGLLFDLGSHLIDQALLLFGPVREVYAELDRRRPGVDADDESFVAVTHASGVRSHLTMSAVAAQPGPRFRMLGTRGAYTKWGLDGQEDVLRAGGRPGGDDWGVEPPDRWGTLGVGDQLTRVPTERGDYGAFYAGVARAIGEGNAPPVQIGEAIRVLEVIEAARAAAAHGTVTRLAGSSTPGEA